MTTILENTRQDSGHSGPAPSGAGPRHLGPPALLDLLRAYVTEAAELVPTPPPALSERMYELLELSDDLEIWAIHWPRGQRLELHDHGGSAGALWVVAGALQEHAVEHDGSSARRTLRQGDGAAFGPTHIHDVVNPFDAPATSIHAYSPPMESMTFYRQEGSRLVVERADYRADPAWAP
jgi:hypothetical protein